MSKMPAYLSLNAGAPRRLATLRAKAKEGQTWRNVRAWGYHNAEAAHGTLAQGFNGEGRAREPVWYAHTGEQFRDERFADECDNAPRHVRNVRGYYTDCDASEVARGIVARLPHGRFLAGYHWDSNGERVYFGEVFTEEEEAARRADSHAERFAEVAREDSERYSAARELEHEIEYRETRLRELLALRHVAKFRANGACDEAREVIGEIRTRRETLTRDYSQYL